MIIYVMLTVFTLWECVPYQLFLKSYACISFLLVRIKSINFAKCVKIFYIIQTIILFFYLDLTPKSDFK